MISKVTEHSTRKISFSFDELKPWTDEDEQLVSLLVKLHDNEQHLLDKGEVLMSETKLINEEIELSRQNLTDVEKQIKEVSQLADSFILPDPKKEDKAKQVFDLADKVYATITTYQQWLITIADNIEKFSVIKSAFIDNLEDFSLWEEYNDVMYEHAMNDENNSIDIVSFELEDELFKAYVSINKDKHHVVFDYADKATENYNTLVLETKIQYAIWEEFLKRIHLMRAIVESSGSQLISSAN